MPPVPGALPGALTAPRRLSRRALADERMRFLAAGVLNTVVGFALFVLVQLTLGQVVHYIAVLLVAHVLSVLSAFAVHRRLVFRVRGNLLVDLLRYELVYLAVLGVNLVALPLLVEVGGLGVVPAQFVIVLAAALASFLGHKHFSFRRRTQQHPEHRA